MKRAKRFLCVLLVLNLVLGLIPYTAFAAGKVLPFTDVNSASWYYEAVQYVYENGMMDGTSSNTFSPDTAATRGMIVTVLHRMEGSPAVFGTSFTDVAEGQWYTSAVAWANANNIAGGYGDGTFGPNDNITREQMATILYRYAQYKGYDMDSAANLSAFTDADSVSAYAAASMQWAVGNSLISGVGNSTLAPKSSAARAQVATILMRFCENITPSDVPENSPSSSGSNPEGTGSNPGNSGSNPGNSGSNPGNSGSNPGNSGSNPGSSGSNPGGSGSQPGGSSTSQEEWHRVTFLYNDGSLSAYTVQIVETNGYVSKPADPKWGNYPFTGWYTNPEATIAYNFSSQITDDVTLYAGWMRADDQLSTASGGETVYSVSAIQMCSRQVDVTINVNTACTLVVEFLDEENNTLLTKISTQTPEYCELTLVSLPVADTLPVYYLIRAVLQDDDGNYLCDPFTTIEYTSAYAKFDALTVYDFGSKTVLNFDQNPEDNFGVLKNGVTIINSTESSNTLEVVEIDVEDSIIPEIVYQFTNVDAGVSSLNTGDRVYIYGTQHLFKIGSIKHSGSSVEITAADNTALSDFYDVLQVNISPGTEEVQTLSARSAQEAPPFANIIELGTTINISTEIGREINWTSGTDAAASISAGIEGTLRPNVKIEYDPEVLGDDYFFISLVIDSDAQVSMNLTGTIGKEFPGIKVPVQTTVPGLVWYTQPALFVEGSISAGASLSFLEQATLGFAYGSYTGFAGIAKTQFSSDIGMQGSIDFKAGIQVTEGVQFLSNVVKCELVERLGPHFDLTVGSSLPGPEDDCIHACELCLEGHAKWFYDMNVQLSYCIIEDKLDAVISVKVLEADVPMSLEDSDGTGRCYFSIKNSADSIHGGKPKFGGGSCPNIAWRSTIQVKDRNGYLALPVEIWKEDGTQVGAGISPYTLYLYNGIFSTNAGLGTEKQFVVANHAQAVTIDLDDAAVCTVTYHSNDGTGAIVTSCVPMGELMTLSECTFSAPAGMEFKAWRIDGAEYAQDSTYLPMAADIEVYAVWQYRYTVTFEANGGNGTMAEINVSEQGTLMFPDCTFTAPAGKKFSAWEIDGAEYSPGSLYSPVTADLTAYAVWTEIQYYAVSFDPNGGDGSMDAGTIPEGESFTLPNCDYTPPDEDYTFKAWQINGMEYPPGAKYTVTSDVTIYAVWKEGRYYTVTFNAGGGSGTPAYMRVEAGGRLDGIPEPTLLSYIFLGWNTESDGSGNVFTGNSPVTEDITVYAQWGRIVGDFVVAGNEGAYSFLGDTLHIKNSNHLTIQNKNVGILTTDHIVIDDGVSANLTLAGVYIDARNADTAAILIAPDSQGDVTITLASGKTNTLYGAKKHPALEKSGTGDAVGTLTINGPGSLTATGGYYSPGIGGGTSGLRNLVINGGRIVSRGGDYGPGIGCTTDYFRGGIVRDVTINGGSVYAYGSGGAGIGTGFTRGDRGIMPENINIFGGTVYADPGAVNTNRGDYIGGAIGTGPYVDVLGEWAAHGSEYSETENWHGTVTRVRGNNSSTIVY